MNQKQMECYDLLIALNYAEYIELISFVISDKPWGENHD